MGHNGRITGVCYSHDRKMLLSSSADGTAMLWSVGSQDSPAVIISHTKHQASPSSSACLTQAVSALSSSSSSVSQSFAPRVKLASFGSYAAAISAADSSAVKADSRNRPFGAEINAAKFFYMDKFVLLVSYNTSSLFDRTHAHAHAPHIKQQVSTFNCIRISGSSEYKVQCEHLHVPKRERGHDW